MVRYEQFELYVKVTDSGAQALEGLTDEVEGKSCTKALRVLLEDVNEIPRVETSAISVTENQPVL